MLRVDAESHRQLKTVSLSADLVIVGGGLAGSCCAITAAREGLKVVLVQDRPVLGGNASSEVRLWVLGATCHMNANQRWAREGGVHDEILVENMYRNPEGNPLIFDTVLMEKVVEEKNITLLLNTAAFEVAKDPNDSDRIAGVRAFCSQNSTMYELRAPLFVDSSGDGIIGFLSGAAFRMGAEKREEFGESFAPSKEYGELLGHSLYFYSKDVGRPVKFVPPSYALKNIPERVPKFRTFNAQTYGCRLWWIEYGGRLDTVHDTEQIKWELWKVVYGVWDYIKNSGQFPEAENLTLEWVGTIPGKRESRRFEGDYMLTQHDVIDRPHFDDAVAFGGWSIDLHPADGVFSERPGCNQYLSKGIYQIPYRCYYSRNIKNLFIAGRIISSSHVAFGSTRVMGTGAHGGQAVAMAAAICTRDGCLPRDVGTGPRLRELQLRLHRTGQHIPGIVPADPQNLAATAHVSASSALVLQSLPVGGPLAEPEQRAQAQMFPLRQGPIPQITFFADAAAPVSIDVELRIASRPDHYSPDTLLETLRVDVAAGQQMPVVLRPTKPMPYDGYLYVCFPKQPSPKLHTSLRRLPGVLRLHYVRREPLSDIGYEDYDRWAPPRRPGGHNLAFELSAPLTPFEPANVINGPQRPTHQPNAWAADFADPSPKLTLAWDRPQTVSQVDVFFDPDYDHAMESVLMGHPERAMPFCVKSFILTDSTGRVLANVDDWRQARWTLRLPEPIQTESLMLTVTSMNGTDVPPAIVYDVRVYA